MYHREMSFITPKKLISGNTVGIISPSAPTENASEAFEKGRHILQKYGLNTTILPSAENAAHYLAGSDAERLGDFHNAFSNPEIHGILCARGGYGAMRLLDHIDWQRVKDNPKIVAGFSDITALLLAMYKHTGLKGFYSPMLTSNLIHNEPYSEAELMAMLMSTSSYPYTVPNLDTYHCINAGVVEAPLIGGNLSLISSMCGSNHLPNFAGHILFLEDWKESYYAVDRKFQQLLLSGILDEVAGILFCDFTEVALQGGKASSSSASTEYPLPDFFKFLTQEITARYNIPCGYGFSVGHGEQTATLPIGAKTRFDAAHGELTLLENPVC